MTKKTIFLKSTVGRMLNGILTRFEFYKNDQDGITVIPVSGNTLNPIKKMGVVNITREQYNDIDIDPYNDSYEWEQTADYFR